MQNRFLFYFLFYSFINSFTYIFNLMTVIKLFFFKTELSIIKIIFSDEYIDKNKSIKIKIIRIKLYKN
jgi:hypothetical protein